MLCNKHALADGSQCWRCRIAELEAERDGLRQAVVKVVTALRWQLNMQEGEINTKISGLRVSERCVAESVVLLEAELAKGEGKEDADL